MYILQYDIPKFVTDEYCITWKLQLYEAASPISGILADTLNLFIFFNKSAAAVIFWESTAYKGSGRMS